jgi:hypothetical protein
VEWKNGKTDTDMRFSTSVQLAPVFGPEAAIGKPLRILLLAGLLLNRLVTGSVCDAPRPKAETMSTNQSGGTAPSGEPSDRGKAREQRPVSDAMLAIILVAVAAALVLGYLFLSKLIDISRQEDCMLAHNKNCATIQLPDR